jgi:hypothetical protein
MSAATLARRPSRSRVKKTATSARSFADLSPISTISMMGTLYRRAVLGISVVSLFLIAPSIPAAQHADHVMRLSVAVNGAETPEQISDQMAYRHLILAVALAQNASDEAISRRDRQLQRAGLSAADRAAFVRALQGLAEQLTVNSEDVKRLSSRPAGAAESLGALRTQRLALLDIARSQVATSLSESGRTRLDSYLREHVKRRIVIYGDVPNELLTQSAESTRR